MTSGGAEALKAALRRSFPIIIGFVVLGIAAVNVVKQLQGPQYEATSKVLISTTPLTNIITGTEPGFVDPQRIQQTAQTLAGSPQVYQLAATREQNKFGTGSKMNSATNVTADPNSDILTFKSSSSNPGKAKGTVNAVASAYVAYRANLTGSSISSTVDRIRATLAGLPFDSPQRAQLQSQLNKLSVLQSVNSSDAVVVQRAASAKKTSPAPLKDSILGASIGLVVALLFVALREAIDTTVRAESDVEDLLSAPVLATVRPIPRKMRMVTYGRHEAAFADAYALLAAQLVQSTGGQDGVVLAVTSSVPGEGKTTTAANLAVVLARRGARVLLGDFDFRNPAIDEVFSLPERAPGALQVAAGSVDLDAALWSVALDGPRPEVSPNGRVDSGNGSEPRIEPNGDEAAAGSLHLLPSGGMVRSQTVTHASRLVPLLGELRGRADFVVLDTPPALLAVEMSELARAIDVVLVVVRQGHVSQRSLRSLRRQARTWDARLAGAVLTDAPVETRTPYYYGAR